MAYISYKAPSHGALIDVLFGEVQQKQRINWTWSFKYPFTPGYDSVRSRSRLIDGEAQGNCKWFNAWEEEK